jgi:beta-lactamase class A
MKVGELEINTKLENKISICIVDQDYPKNVVEYRGDVQIEIGSTFKAILLGKAIKLIELGFISENDKVLLKESYLCDDSVVFGNSIGLYVEIKELLSAMIGRSDNTATEAIIDIVNKTDNGSIKMRFSNIIILYLNH